jgi:hypothetical protein
VSCRHDLPTRPITVTRRYLTGPSVCGRYTGNTTTVVIIAVTRNWIGVLRERLAFGRALSRFKIVATLPIQRTPENTSEPLDGVVGTRGRGVPISGNAA